MFRTLCALIVIAQLTPKDLMPKFSQTLRLLNSNSTCAIPLKEIQAGNSIRIDPIARPTGNNSIDKGIARPVPMPVCKAH